MNTHQSKNVSKLFWPTLFGAVAVIALLASPRWGKHAPDFFSRTLSLFRSSSNNDPHEVSGPDQHNHAAHAGHEDATSLELSPQAIRNVGLTPEHIRPIRLETFHKSITVPAVVVERPGRTHVQVATPMTGVITHVHAMQGEAVEPGALLFKIRLTHEDLVQAQTSFLQTLGELDVEEREIKRLTGITSTGAVAGKVLLERQYAKDKLTALLLAQREALRLHGLSEQQVDRIAETRRLLRELRVLAPSVEDQGTEELKLSRMLTHPVAYESYARPRNDSLHSEVRPLMLLRLDVHKGQSVMAGETLCVLADYEELYIQGLAFEQDISQLRQASERGWGIDALFEQPGSEASVVPNLEIAYLANEVDETTRTLPFYVRLPNEVTNDRRAGGNRFVEWRYLPGQRLRLRIPVEEWSNQIVLSVDAVARGGAEYFVFQQNGGHFDRVPVHVKYKDQHSVVIENDGALFPGDVVAMRGAHQMQMALKNESGGAVDPHAGHSH